MRVEGGDARGFTACRGWRVRVEVEWGLRRRFVAHAAADSWYGRVEVGMGAEIVEGAGSVSSASDTVTGRGAVGLRMAMVGGMMRMRVVVGGMGLLGMVSSGCRDIKDVMCMRSVIIIAGWRVGGSVTGRSFMGGVAGAASLAVLGVDHETGEFFAEIHVA